LRRLAGKLDQGLEHARLLLGPEYQIRVKALRSFLEAARPVLVDRRPAAWGNVEVATVAQHSEEHGGEVPRRPVMRWRDIVNVSRFLLIGSES
jgi:hypothetical protein